MKKAIAVTMSLALAASTMAANVMADDKPIKITVNGAELVIPAGDTTPFIENDRTLVPMRAIFEALGAKVNWDGETKTIVSYDPASDISITMQIDSKTMFVGENKVELDVPAKIVNDRTVVPIRAIAEGMKSKVDWDGEKRLVSVVKEVLTDADKKNADTAKTGTDADKKDTDTTKTGTDADKQDTDTTKTGTDADKKDTDTAKTGTDADKKDADTAKTGTDADKKDADTTKTGTDADKQDTTSTDTKIGGNGSTQLADPWYDFGSLYDLNTAISRNGGVKFEVADPAEPATVAENGYRYLVTSNIAEIIGRWDVGSGSDFAVRTAPGKDDISGIYGGKQVEEFVLDNGTKATLYTYENTYYAIWTSGEGDAQLSHSVAVTDEEKRDMTSAVKALANDVEKTHVIVKSSK